MMLTYKIIKKKSIHGILRLISFLWIQQSVELQGEAEPTSEFADQTYYITMGGDKDWQNNDRARMKYLGKSLTQDVLGNEYCKCPILTTILTNSILDSYYKKWGSWGSSVSIVCDYRLDNQSRHVDHSTMMFGLMFRNEP
jgi:hypothetical protein